MAEYRPSLTPEGRDGLKAEIFLYDTLPGGAGFASQLVHHGTELLARALQIVWTCPENCDASCYRCLRSFKNKFEHALLDRHVAADLLEYLITGALPEFDPQRLQKSTSRLYNDLVRQDDRTFGFQPNVPIDIPGLGSIELPILAIREDGKRFAIALSGPLTNDYAADPAIRRLRETSNDIDVVVINELLVRGNLPTATRIVQGYLQR